MYFGLCNFPGTFQWMMNSIFQELLHKGILTNYMDDFMIPVKNMKKLKKEQSDLLKSQKDTISILNSQNITLIWRKY